MESKIVYFESLSPENTLPTLKMAKERVKELGIRKVVLASTTGATARVAMEYFKDTNVQLVVVPHQFGFRNRKNHLFPPELTKELRNAGHAVHFGTMLFHTDQLYGSSVPTLMANLLRCFCQGIKVCFEIVMMATDAGYLDRGEKILAIAGTVKGVDTALVMQAGTSQHIMNVRVNEILCKPLNPLRNEELQEKMGINDMDELRDRLSREEIKI